MSGFTRYVPFVAVLGFLAASCGEADFTGMLSTRTVTKVLFRFCVVEETGLLVLTGPKVSGRQAELMEWLHGIQVRAGATITSSNSDVRTCEIHLEANELAPDKGMEAKHAEIAAACLRAHPRLERYFDGMAVSTTVREPDGAIKGYRSPHPFKDAEDAD